MDARYVKSVAAALADMTLDTQLDKAERALMHAEAGCRTKPEMRDDIIAALRVVRAVHKEMVGW